MKKLFIILLGLLWFGCTDNPFGGDKKISDRTITGHVKLDEVPFYPDGYHGGILVWSEGLGLKDVTDIDGSFELVLPAANAQSSGAVVDGDYTIEFFLANYKVSSVTVTFAAGQVVNDPKVINLEGELLRDVSMTRIAGVHTVVSPEVITDGFGSTVSTRITVTPDRTDIFFYLKKYTDRSGSIYTGLLIKNKSTNKLAYAVDIDSASVVKEYMNRPKKEINIEFEYDNINLPKGTYEVVPYFVIKRDDIPKTILNVLDQGYDSFNENYFKYPFYRTGGKLVVE